MKFTQHMSSSSSHPTSSPQLSFIDMKITLIIHISFLLFEGVLLIQNLSLLFMLC